MSRFTKINHSRLFFFSVIPGLMYFLSAWSQEIKSEAEIKYISVHDFLPESFKTDGSVSYQRELQEALDAAGHNGTVVFPSMIYTLDEKGLQLHPNLTLMMYGAVFQLKKDCTNDGQVFYGHNLTNLRLIGGEIAGSAGHWPEGINIRGIYLTGKSEKIYFHDMYIHNLTSNGIGVFGTEEGFARDIRVTDTIIENGCNYYGDYLSERPGPEKGSLRQDQGLIAFYYVQDFTVRGCRFERSRSDGTHFYNCKRGQFVQNRVYRAQMGGYFLEGCEDVAASDNIIRDNGSRGVTIERGSKRCLLSGNIVANSGREGLWAPNCAGLIILGNIFDRNGRKPNGTKTNQIWNANITVNDAHDPTHTLTRDYIISNNIFYTTNSQLAAIRIDGSTVKDIVIKNNMIRGENDLILVEGENINNVQVVDNY